jgi:hypothetical protein
MSEKKASMNKQELFEKFEQMAVRRKTKTVKS